MTKTASLVLGAGCRTAGRRAIVLVFLLCLVALPARSQTLTWTSDGKTYELVPPSEEVLGMIASISHYGGTVMNYAVYEAKDCDNATATYGVVNGKRERRIIYDGAFLEELARSAKSDWARVAVLAHEIGHHVNAHTFLGDGTLAGSRAAELEADLYAGWVLGMMGAQLAECQRMWDYLPDPANVDQSTHPARADRKKSVGEGWYRAQHLKRNTNPTPDFGTSCPIIRLDVPGVSATEYRGKFGDREAALKLVWEVDGSALGRCDLVDAKGVKSGTLVKGSKSILGGVRLEQYESCVVLASLDLFTSNVYGYEYLNGKCVLTNGSEEQVSLKSVLPRLTSTDWTKLPSWPYPSTTTPAPAPPGSRLPSPFDYKPPSPFENPLPQPSSTAKLPWYDSPWKDWVPPPLPPVQEAPKVAEISTIGGFAGAWFCVTSKGTPYTLQSYRVESQFPADYIKTYREKGYFVTHVAGDGGGWAVVTSKGAAITEQKILGPSLLPRAEVETLHAQGWRLTSIAGFQDQWVVVMSKGTPLGEQQISALGEWPESWIKERQTQGYRITAVAGDTNTQLADSRIVVMSRNAGLGEQVWSDGGSFPRDWIREKWNQNFRITGASGYSRWRIVMSKDSGLTDQAYPPISQQFPDDHVAKEWRGEQ
jgi:hypothetical protein